MLKRYLGLSHFLLDEIFLGPYSLLSHHNSDRRLFITEIDIKIKDSLNVNTLSSHGSS